MQIFFSTPNTLIIQDIYRSENFPIITINKCNKSVQQQNVQNEKLVFI